MIIFGVVLYFVLGYGMYRLTCVINPPVVGYGNLANEDYTTWEGSHLSSVLGVCLLLWPIVLGVESIRFVNFTIHHLLQDQVKKSITKSIPIVKSKDAFIEEGVREMEECLTETVE